MNAGLKVVLWVLGILGGLFLILIVAGFFIGRAVLGDAEEGAKFAAAANATHEDCVTEFAKRVKACDGVSCTVHASAFGGSCLSVAKGDRAKFCANIPNPRDQIKFTPWTGGFCSRHDIASDKCGMAAGAVAAFCGNSSGQ